MDAKKFIMATLAGGVTLFCLGYVFYEALLGDFFKSAAGDSAALRQEPIIWAIFVGETVIAAVLTMIFGRWAAIKTFVGGAKAGAILGVLLALGINFTLFGTTTMMTMVAAVVVDPLISLVRLGVAGGVIGWVLGR